MRKQLNLTFIKQMIDLKFPFVQVSGKKKVLNTVTDRISIKNKNYDVLEIFKMNSSLKQFIRIQSMITRNMKENYSNLQIYVWCPNKFLMHIMKEFTKTYNISKHFIFFEIFPTTNIIENEDKQKMLLIIGEKAWTNKSTQMFSTHILSNKIVLVESLNFVSDKPQLGFYKIQNDMFIDYKKCMILLSIIDNVIGKSKKINTSN